MPMAIAVIEAVEEVTSLGLRAEGREIRMRIAKALRLDVKTAYQISKGRDRKRARFHFRCNLCLLISRASCRIALTTSVLGVPIQARQRKLVDAILRVCKYGG
jgi:hypothetical protein